MSVRVIVRHHEYYDSVRLMRVSERVRQEEGVKEAIVVMATDNNKRLLEVAGLLTDEVTKASRNDLVVAISATSEDAADKAVEKAVQLLKEKAAGSTQLSYRTLDSALNAMRDASVAVISVPGEYAAIEAKRALERGLHVMLFSDNVSLNDEVELKQLARGRGLLLMGPDCGTAIINRVGLGFANAVRPGPVGIVGASGTGIQEIAVLVHRQGSGVSHAIGTGSHDLSAAVRGITMLQGIDLLENDMGTEVIVLTSKPPDPAVVEIVLARVARCAKPVVVNFLGIDSSMVSCANAIPAATLEQAALEAVRMTTGDRTSPPELAVREPDIQRLIRQQTRELSASQRFVRALFSGGTLCYEAMLVLRDSLGDIYSNAPLRAELRLKDAWVSYRHSAIDLGADEFTTGRAHPMIDPTLRAQRLLREAQDPEVAVVLLDVMLGYGGHPDPAGSLIGAIKQAKSLARAEGRNLAVIASVCGTEDDPQGLREQEKALTDAGVVVAPSNAQASKLAGLIVQTRGDGG